MTVWPLDAGREFLTASTTPGIPAIPAIPAGTAGPHRSLAYGHQNDLAPQGGMELTAFHSKLPTYAAWPNLVWQTVSASGIKGVTYRSYREDGRQAISGENKCWKARDFGTVTCCPDRCTDDGARIPS